MRKYEEPVPFGLLFEEVAPEPQGLIIPVYDESQDLSCIQDPEGKWIPFVEFEQSVGTQTGTKIRREVTDTDPGDDQQNLAVVGTMTVTEVRKEATDTDPEDDHGYTPVVKSLLGTDTITRIDNENTDQD